MNEYKLNGLLVKFVFFISMLMIIINVSLAKEYEIAEKSIETSRGTTDVRCEKEIFKLGSFTIPSETTRLSLQWDCDDGCIIRIGNFFRTDVNCCEDDGFAIEWKVHSGIINNVPFTPGTYNIKVDARNAHEVGKCVGEDSCGSGGCATYVFGTVTIKAYGQCTDACNSGQTGCSSDLTKRWYCEDNNADTCFEQIYEDCGNGEECNNGVCICQGTTEICDGLDNDCDGAVDEDNVCTPLCTTEICDGLDNDCDGAVDEDLTDIDGCNQVGYCAGSYKTCSAGSWGACNKLPQTEICSNNMDDDCNGQVDEVDCITPCTTETCNNIDDDCDGIKDDENVCCDFSNLDWKLPQQCIGNSIGQGYNLPLFVKGNSKCSFGNYGDTIGVFRPSNGMFYLRNSNSAGPADVSFGFGANGDLPIAGDWNNDGINNIGIFRPSESKFYLRNSNSAGPADISPFAFGINGDKPVAGDWNNDGVDTVGVYRPSTSTFFLRNSNANGAADLTVTFGVNGDLPVAGDWNNDGVDTIGIFRPSNGMFYLRNSNSEGAADLSFGFGTNGDLPVAGDWNNDGVDTIGVFRPSNGMFYLRNSNSAGSADVSFGFGADGDLPVAGDIDGSKKVINPYVIISVKEKDLISNDDDVSKEPLPNQIWFGLNGDITSNWVTEYQEDESGTNPEYYIIAEFGNLSNANNKDTKASPIKVKVKACNRIKDLDCDGVKDEKDECPNSNECAVVNSNGCETDTGEAKCQAFWDCSMVSWSDCNENNKQTRDLCKIGIIEDCCGTWPLDNKCACKFSGTQEDFNNCKNYFMPLTEKTCFTEEAFPAFTLSNLIITILIIAGFYTLRKKIS